MNLHYAFEWKFCIFAHLNIDASHMPECLPIPVWSNIRSMSNVQFSSQYNSIFHSSQNKLSPALISNFSCFLSPVAFIANALQSKYIHDGNHSYRPNTSLHHPFQSKRFTDILPFNSYAIIHPTIIFVHSHHQPTDRLLYYQ